MPGANGRHPAPADISVGATAHTNVPPDPSGRPEIVVQPIQPTRIGPSALAQDSADQALPPARMSSEELREAEGDIVDVLFGAHERSMRQVVVIEIPRLGSVPLFDDQGRVEHNADGSIATGVWAIRVRPLHHEQLLEAERRARKVWRPSERTGKREWVSDPVDQANWIVYMGTVPEDRQRPGGWDDQRMWARFGVQNGPELVEKLLLVGEKNRVADEIRKASGIQTDEELVGNASGGEGES